MKTSTLRSLSAGTLACAAVLASFAAAESAEARPRGRAHIGVWVGGPFWWGMPFYGHGYGYPYVVERPVIVQVPAEPVMVLPAQQSHSWYYCRDAQMYYPYVTQCASAWQEVPATAEPAAAPTTPAPAAAASPAPAKRGPGTPVPAAPAR